MKHHALLDRRETHRRSRPAPVPRPAAVPRQAALPVRHTRRVLPQAWAFVLEHLLFLPAGAVIALAWANTYPESYFRTTFVLGFAVNEIAMAFFFGLVTKEIVEATVSGGVLHPLRRALLPFVAAIGVVAASAFVFVAAAYTLDAPLLGQAWLVAATVDVALAYFVARLVLTPSHPARQFLLLVAISADGIALTLLGVVYPARPPDLLAAALLFATAISTAAMLRRAGVLSFWPYVLVSGGFSWAAFYVTGFHPVLALVPVLPFMPRARRDPGFLVDPRPRAIDTLNRFERWWRHPVQAILFLFGLVNAGVLLRSVEIGVWALPIAMLLGRPVGILAGVAVGRWLGLHLPRHVGWRDVVVIGWITSAGFTVGLFVAGAALGPGQLLAETRAGILLALLGLPLAAAAARLLKVGRFAGERPWHAQS